MKYFEPVPHLTINQANREILIDRFINAVNDGAKWRSIIGNTTWKACAEHLDGVFPDKTVDFIDENALEMGFVTNYGTVSMHRDGRRKTALSIP